MTEFDAATLDWKTQYKLLIGSITPRPIALVTTLGSQGPNAAPFSFFNGIGSDPAMLMFSVGDKDGGAKDTIANILEIPEFVVHIVSDAIKEKMNVCAIDYPRAHAGRAHQPLRPHLPPHGPLRFQAPQPRRQGLRLAHHLRRPGALLRQGRRVDRRLWHPGGPGEYARRAFPTGARVARPRAHHQESLRQAQDPLHPLAPRHPHQAAQWPARLPLLRRVRARLRGQRQLRFP